MQKLGEIASVKGGKRLPKGESLTIDPTSHPYIRTRDIENHVIKMDQLEYVPDAVQKKIARYIVDAGDLVVSIVGTVGSCAIVPAELHRANLTENCAKILLNTEDYTTEFLYYFLRSPQGQQEIFKNTVGSTQLKLPLYGIEYIDLPNLTVTNQKAIAHILGTLDAKIELNQKMNQTLEEIAKAIFKSWFVDFDSVRAKAEGRPTGLPSGIRDLFPDEVVDSEIGAVPKGCVLRRLDSLLELAYGKSLPAKNRLDGEVPVYGSGGVNGFHNKPLVEGTSIVVGRKGTVGSLYWVDKPFFPIDTVFYVRTEESIHYCFYLMQTLRLDTMNTDAAVPGLNRDNAYRLEFPNAPTPLVNHFSEIAKSTRDRISIAEEESKVLSDLRDTLLPKLISGEFRIPDAEKFLEEAGI